MEPTLTDEVKLAVFIKALELIFDKDKYDSAMVDKRGMDVHLTNLGRNYAVAGYTADLATQLLRVYQSRIADL